MKMKFQTGRSAVFAMIFSLCLGNYLIGVSCQGYLLLHFSGHYGKTTGISAGSYTQSLHGDGNTNQYVSYYFYIDGRRFHGSEVSIHWYRPGQAFPVYYRTDDPEVNGILKIHPFFLLFGTLLTFFSLSGLRRAILDNMDAGEA